MHWANKYLKIEYKKMNCSKFCEFVLRDHFKKDFNFPQSEGTLFNQSIQIQKNIPLFAEKTSFPKDGDLVLMHGARRLCHVGIYVNINGIDYVLHCESAFKSSCLQRFSDLPLTGYKVHEVYSWLR